MAAPGKSGIGAVVPLVFSVLGMGREGEEVLSEGISGCYISVASSADFLRAAILKSSKSYLDLFIFLNHFTPKNAVIQMRTNTKSAIFTGQEDN